jgi:formylglycine-generating enzyme required for sulfatase activity
MPADARGELTAGQWRRLEALLPEALALRAEARQAFLDRECAGDVALRAELDALLAAHEKTGPLDRPVASLAGITPPGHAELPPGTVVAHYRIEERIGSGGMGVVYRARDLRLDRVVALKFLPPALSADEHAKRRFLTEARAAAGLEDVNVCTIHEIGETDDGRLFIAMAFVEGESLRGVIDRGPLPVSRALDIAVQIARGLGCAHSRGIVHRDVKPANVMVAAGGVVKLVDFGVAKLAGSTLTNAGTRPGTAAYMSPEQARGEDVDHRADVWALGVVLYEMLAGRRPFPGDTDAAMLHAITGTAPAPLRSVRPGVSTAVERIVARALEKDRERRFPSADAMRAALLGAFEQEGAVPAAKRTRRARAPLLAAAVLLVLAATAAGVITWRNLGRRQALASLPRIERLVADGRYADAYALAAGAERWLPRDTMLSRLMPLMADRITIVSQPAGARVWLRAVADDGSLVADSTPAGLTPVRGLRVARADYHVSIVKDGFVPVERIASSAWNRAEASMGVPEDVTIDVTLREAGEVPEGMVFVPGSTYTLVGREAPTDAGVELADFFIDAHEVTNEEYREFVVAGGYAEPRYWRHRFVLDGRELSWAEAMRRLVDRTGLPGPRGWTGQEYPAGAVRHPVTGVTWYEAAAYAEFAGKRLPTIFEWEKAARDGRYTHFEQLFLPWGLADPARGIARRANFASGGAEPVGSHASGISPYGAYDMAGNVEEWIANPSGGERFITGGAWDDPMYVFANYLGVSPLHAAPTLGFRCARDVEGARGESGGFEVPAGDRTPEYRAIDDATFRTLLLYYAYDRDPLEPAVVERVTTEDWTRETIRIAGPWPDPTLLYLYLPNRGVRPLQTIVFVPGSNTFLEQTLASETERFMGPHVKAGRAVLAVLFKGMLGRPWDPGRTAPATSSVQYRQELVLHATELRRGLDYLATRADIDTARIAYLGVSLGSGSWLPLAAIDARFRSVVLVGGGIDERRQPTLPEASNFNFAPRIRAPKLLLNGRYDEEHPWDRRALPLWNLLREPKRLALVDGGHFPPAEARVPAINAWLDETLGPVR